MRLRKGKIITGPDHTGCIESGFAPAIWNVGSARLSVLGVKSLYVVGPIILIRRLMDSRTSQIIYGKGPTLVDCLGKRSVRFGDPDDQHRQVFVFRTAKPALIQFERLCRGILDENRADAARARKARADLTGPDHVAATAAAFELHDMGLL